MTTGLCWFFPATAQTVTPTVGEGSVGTVVDGTGAFTVTGGTITGGNTTGGTMQPDILFHSFESFSPHDLDVRFQLDSATQTSIENVVVRVTGSDLSFINGQLSLTGGNNPNLFLINPQGIHFGAEASLLLPGAFISSTAESVLFSEGIAFSAREPGAAPSLLTVSAPIGLQMGADSAPIRVDNTGHKLAAANSVTTVDGLRVADGESLVLVGGNVTLNGGVLTAPGGRIELGAIGQQQTPETVALTQENNSWTLNYGDTVAQGTIEFSETALVSAGGSKAGSVQTQSRQLTLQGGSAIQIRNSGSSAAGPINLTATDTIEFTGAANNGFISGVYSESVGSGSSSEIMVSAERFRLQDSGNLTSNTYSTGRAGNVSINVDNLQFIDTITDDRMYGLVGSSGIGASNTTTGDVVIDTRRLDIIGAGAISGSQRLSQNVTSGKIIINASEAIRLAVTDPDNYLDAIIGASVVSASGTAGDITITTPRLSLEGGALISSSTYGGGNSGNITVNASESVYMTGERYSPQRMVVEGSSIRTAGIFLPILQAFGLPATVTGTAGNITINTSQLSLVDNAVVTVRHESEGDAGTISVNADVVSLDQGGELTAETTLGEGGSVSLNVDSLLSLRNGSTVTATAGGFGNGGNVFISSPVILGLENSDIAANAANGSGGNIAIITEGLIGLAQRAAPTAESDITASSELGVSGTVEITSFDETPTQNFVVLSDRLADASDQVAQGCAENSDNQFLATGRGGIPVAPMQTLSMNRTWTDTRAPISLSFMPHSNVHAFVPDLNQSLTTDVSTVPEPLIEVNDWYINSQGNVELMALNVTQSALTAQNFCTAASEKIGQASLR